MFPWNLRPFFEAWLNPVPCEPDPVDEVIIRHDHPFKGRAQPRDVSRIIAVTIHQTAVEFGVGRKFRNAPEREREAAYHARFESVPYHFVALRNRDLFYGNPPERYTYHGGPLNGRSIGFAVEGSFPAFTKNRKPKHTEITQERIDAWRYSFRWAVGTTRRAGAPLRYVWTHRQGSKNRAGDPGEEIMDLIIRPELEPLGLELAPAWSTGTGKPLPPDWLA